MISDTRVRTLRELYSSDKKPECFAIGGLSKVLELDVPTNRKVVRNMDESSSSDFLLLFSYIVSTHAMCFFIDL